jgi:hypothetical protein
VDKSVQQEASAEYRSVVPELHFNKGLCYHKKNRFTEAYESYKLSIDSGGSNKLKAMCYYNMGVLANGDKDSERAIRMFRDCLHYDQSFSQAEDAIVKLLPAYKSDAIGYWFGTFKKEDMTDSLSHKQGDAKEISKRVSRWQEGLKKSVSRWREGLKKVVGLILLALIVGISGAILVTYVLFLSGTMHEVYSIVPLSIVVSLFSIIFFIWPNLQRIKIVEIELYKETPSIRIIEPLEKMEFMTTKITLPYPLKSFKAPVEPLSISLRVPLKKLDMPTAYPPTHTLIKLR